MASVEEMRASGQFKEGASCFVRFDESGQVEEAEIDEILWDRGMCYVVFPNRDDAEQFCRLSDLSFSLQSSSAADKKKLFDDFAVSKPALPVSKKGDVKWTPLRQDSCVTCGKVAYQTERLTIEKAFVHKACFTCTLCGVKLKPTDYAKTKSKFYCKPHFHQLLQAAGGDYDKIDTVSDSAPVRLEKPSQNTPEAVHKEKTLKTVKRKATRKVKRRLPPPPQTVEQGLLALDLAASSKEGFNMLIGFIRKALKDPELSQTMSKEIKGAKKHVLALNRATTALNKAVDSEGEDDLALAIDKAMELGLKREVMIEARELLAELRQEELPDLGESDWTDEEYEEEVQVTDSEEEEVAEKAETEQTKAPAPGKISTSFFEKEMERAASTAPIVRAQKKMSFSAQSAPKCALCCKAVYKVDEIVVEKKIIHRLCFRCAKCKSKLLPTNFAKINNEFYCKPHFKQLLAAEGGKYSESFGQEVEFKKTTAAIHKGAASKSSKSKAAFFEQAAAQNAKKTTVIRGSSSRKGFKVSSGPSCFLCGKTVYKTEELIVEKKACHKLCFRCEKCQTKLTSANFAHINNKFYCKPHFKQLLAEEGGKYSERFGEDLVDNEDKQELPSNVDEKRAAKREARRARRRAKLKEEREVNVEPTDDIDLEFDMLVG